MWHLPLPGSVLLIGMAYIRSSGRMIASRSLLSPFVAQWILSSQDIPIFSCCLSAFIPLMPNMPSFPLFARSSRRRTPSFFYVYKEGRSQEVSPTRRTVQPLHHPFLTPFFETVLFFSFLLFLAAVQPRSRNSTKFSRISRPLFYGRFSFWRKALDLFLAFLLLPENPFLSILFPCRQRGFFLRPPSQWMAIPQISSP